MDSVKYSVRVTRSWKGEVREIAILSRLLTGKDCRLVIVITVKLIATNNATPMKINIFRENIRSAYDHFS